MDLTFIGTLLHQYSFIGASPDGINTDPNNSRYGRMLEIKNIVNREINYIFPYIETNFNFEKSLLYKFFYQINKTIQRKIIKGMKSRKYGRIVNGSSIGVKFGGGENNFPYSLSKHADGGTKCV